MMARPGAALGLLPEISMLSGAGLILVAAGDSLARTANPLGDVLFWAGIILIVLPVALRLLDPRAHRIERVGLVILMGIALYVVKILHSPDGFTLYDELLHIRTTTDITDRNALFLVNPLLLVSPLHPGLEVITAILMDFTGVDVFSAGLVVVGAARILLALGVFLFFETVSGSTRVAGIASFVYMANPNFIFFDAQFSYESLGIPLAVAAFYLTAASEGEWRRGAIGAVLAVAGVIITHHITTYAMVTFLVVWSVIWLVTRARTARTPGPWRVTVIAVIGTLAWLVVVASETFIYLGPRVADGFELIRLLVGDVSGRQPFQATTGEVAPLWERAVGYGAVLILLISLPVGLYRIWRDLRHRPEVIALGLAALTYPATLALRLTARGTEEASRTSGFLFLGLGLVTALAIASAPGFVARRQLRYGSIVAAAGLVLLLGGSVVGTPRWARLPGPFLAAADTRSIEAQNVAAAEWMLRALGPGNATVSDRTNRILLGSYGRQDPVTEYGNGVRTWRIFYRAELEPQDQTILELGAIDYVVIDTRLAGIKPVTRVFFEAGEPLDVAREAGLTMQGLTKFGDLPGVNTVLDSGDIRIYDVRALRGDTTAGATPQ